MRKRVTIVVLAVAIFLCLGTSILETQIKIIHRAIDNLVYDNRNRLQNR